MKIKERGFTVVETLLIIIALTLVIFVGLYVNNTNKHNNSSQSKSAVDDTKPSTSRPVDNSQTKVIKELGVKITLDDAIKDIQYTPNIASAEDTQTTSISVTTKSLDEAFRACGASETAYKQIMVIKRGNGTYVQGNDFFVTLLKQFESFYLTRSSPDGGPALICNQETSTAAQRDEVSKKASQVVTSLTNAFKNAQISEYRFIYFPK